jgi:hypothetical protein
MADQNKSTTSFPGISSYDLDDSIKKAQDTRNSHNVDFSLPLDKQEQLLNTPSPILECLREMRDESKKTSEKLDKILDELQKLNSKIK